MKSILLIFLTCSHVSYALQGLPDWVDAEGIDPKDGGREGNVYATGHLDQSPRASSCLDEGVYIHECTNPIPARQFLSPGASTYLINKLHLKRQDFVSNLRRSIDTWAIGLREFNTQNPQPMAIMTSDIQELSCATDSTSNIGYSPSHSTPASVLSNPNAKTKRERSASKIKYPWVGSRQKCAIARTLSPYKKQTQLCTQSQANAQENDSEMQYGHVAG